MALGTGRATADDRPVSEPWLEVLSYDECVSLLRAHHVGRIGFDAEGVPAILPVNYRLVEAVGRVWVALRTRPGNILDRASMHVAFQIDDVNVPEHQGWSVLVRGTLHHLDADIPWVRERFDAEPWLGADRTSWLVVDPFEISGRRLHADAPEWAFHVRAYL
jgi:nitroimidazol reductase NimA-like FMN-containing flavoprotein (pyridoxamine 5'-phosphate oxidase superfamily)